MADINKNNDERTCFSSSQRKVLEMDVLEELLRAESMQHIDAAWRAQRRLMRSCIRPDDADIEKMGTEDATKEPTWSNRADQGDVSRNILFKTAADFKWWS